MKQGVYLDHSATTRVEEQVVDLMVEMMREEYGNPSSLHRMGLKAEKRIKKAREQLAKVLGVKSKELVFTSGGTEANNLAIRGVAHQYASRGKHLITTTIEHPSVLHTFKRLEKEGYLITYLKVDGEGFIDLEELKAAVTPETILVSIMHVNNELGSIQPIKEIGYMLKEIDSRIIFHVDAVQSFCKLAVQPKELKVDLMTVSGHKIHGPKGVGALYINEKITLKPLIEGGGQERDLRSGTENVPGMVGFGLAAQLMNQDREKKLTQLKELKVWFLTEIQNRIPDVKINGPATVQAMIEGWSAPHIINLSIPGLKAEVLLHTLEDQGIYVSTGSACHSRQSAPSHVLQAIKIDARALESALRISLSFHTTREELEYVLEKLPYLVEELRILMRR